MTKFYTKDYGLTAEHRDFKYSPDGEGEHPDATRRQWRSAVAQQSTIVGYWAWVEYEIEMAEAVLSADSPYNQTGDSDAVQN